MEDDSGDVRALGNLVDAELRTTSRDGCLCPLKPTCAPKIKSDNFLVPPTSPTAAVAPLPGNRAGKASAYASQAPVSSSLIQHYSLRRVNTRGRRPAQTGTTPSHYPATS
jgi:hypothetical protein